MGDSRGDATGVINSSGLVLIPVVSTAVVYTNSFSLRRGQVFGLACIMAGTGTPNMKIELQQSPVRPAAEGSADANYVVGDGVPDVYSSLNGTVMNVKAISPVPMPFGRLKITGLGSNPSDATIKAWIFQQEIAGL